VKLQMIGCSHQTAAVDFRERLSFSADQAREAIRAFRERFPACELVLLSTCNRVELYTAAGESAPGKDLDGGPDRSEVIEFLAGQRQVSVDDLMDALIYRSGSEAVAHLFAVAASLDSMVFGETQILSQVKEAYDLACSAGSAGPLTHAAFQAANRVAKRVQRETTIHRKRVSVPSVAIGEVASEFFETLSGKTIVLLGAGNMGREAMRYLVDSGANNVRILNRTESRAEELAQDFNARAFPWDRLDEQLIQADILIGTTSSPEPVVSAERFRTARSRRYERTLLILDLAVPRDVAPEVGVYDEVYLYGVDDLQAACERNRQERQRQWPKAKKIIDEETERFVAELHHRTTGPVIQRLRDHADEIRREEWQRLSNKLSQMEIPDEARREIEKSLDRVINKLLHPPLATLREAAADGHQRGLLEAIKRLFSLGD
jgi:glutamyl-tRNA reductase